MRDRRRGGRVTLARRRGRAAAPRGPLRPGGRPALRLHLGLDQVDARLGPRRLALLPRGDARGRRGPALHRPADGHPRLRGHRQRRPAGARWSPSPPPRPSSTSGCPRRSLALAQAAIYLSLAPEVQRRQAARSRRRARHVREHGAARPARPPAQRRLPAAAKALGRGVGLRQPARPPGPRQRPGAPARGPRGPALLRARRRRAGAARAPAADPRARAAGIASRGACPQPDSVARDCHRAMLSVGFGSSSYLRRHADSVFTRTYPVARAARPAAPGAAGRRRGRSPRCWRRRGLRRRRARRRRLLRVRPAGAPCCARSRRLDGGETLVGIGAIDLDEDAEPDSVVDERLAGGVGRAARRGCSTRAALGRTRPAA